MGRVKDIESAALFTSSKSPPAQPQVYPPRKLSAEEEEKIACTKLRVELHMPELVPEIKALYAAGMIDGWRAVSNFEFVEAT